VAVNGRDALQLWMALAQPVSLAQARAFLDGLVARYLPALPPASGGPGRWRMRRCRVAWPMWRPSRPSSRG
jgi:hypothetical protein